MTAKKGRAVEADDDARTAELQARLNRTLRQLSEAKARKSELVEAVYSAARDGVAALRLPGKVPSPRRDRRKGEEVCVPLVSDLQLAKVTPDYDSDVCEARMEQYADKVCELAAIQRSDHPVRRAHVACLGDIVEGELIFPGQSFLVDGGLYRQVTVDGPRIMVNFLRRMLSEFDRVDVTWVIGNHGRLGRKGEHDPESNADRMLGRIVEGVFSAMGEDRIRFTIPDGRRERNWYAVLQEGRYRALCIHGDQIRGHSGFPWYGLAKKVNSWAAGAIGEPFQDVLMGHWHQLARIPLNSRSVWVNGSTESYNTYAQENLAAMSTPSQWTLFVHPEAGRVTASYGVDLD